MFGMLSGEYTRKHGTPHGTRQIHDTRQNRLCLIPIVGQRGAGRIQSTGTVHARSGVRGR